MSVILKSRDERQEEARIKWVRNKCRGCWVFPTGTGKTYAAIKAIKSIVDKYPSIRFMIVVPTDNLKVQWEQYIDSNGLSLNGFVEIINSVVKREWNTDILCIDEIHLTPTNVFGKVFSCVKYKYILGLTATYYRLDGKETVLKQYCPIIDTISTKEALLNNWISTFKEYLVLLNVDDIDTYKGYNKEFVKYFEFFNFDWNLVMSLLGKDGFKNKSKLRDRMCPNGNEEQRKRIFQQITVNSMGFMRALQKRKAFINNHPKKIEIARKIIEARPFSKIITFSNNIKMAESIGIGEVYTGKDSKKKARANLEEFNKTTVGVINSVKKLVTGADIKGLSVAIMLGIDSSMTRAIQSRGRVIRFEEGKQAEIFNLIIADTVESEWLKKSHPEHNYITIDEQGLDAVLRGEEPKPYTKKIKDFTFRY